MPSKKPVRAKKSRIAKAKTISTRAARSPKIAGEKSTWMAGAIAVAIVGAALMTLLFAARDSSPVAAAATMDAREAGSTTSAEPAKKSAAPKTTAYRPPSPAEPRDVATAPEDEPAATIGTVSGAVSITGCLQRTDEGFVLKDTDGAAAPKSRSWKSGFLKKSSASLDVSGAASGVRLSDHVGQRVSATGTVIDREMFVQSMRRVAASCK